MNAYILKLCALVVFTISAGAQTLQHSNPTDVGFSEKRLSYIDKTFEKYLTNQELAGGALLIARHGKIIWNKPFGWQDKEASIPMQSDSLFRIASQTKALTSVGIMILQERGELLISEPISKYLPEFANTTVADHDGHGSYKIVPAKRQITIRDLLTHSSGIGYSEGLAEAEWKKAGLYNWYFADKTKPMRHWVKLIASLPQVSHPGERFVYGYNTDILGVIIEEITQKSLKTFLQEAILTPLNMKDTHFYVPQNKADRLSVVYDSAGQGIKRAPNTKGGQGHYTDGPRTAFSGGAGLVSTTLDYGRFLQMLLNGGTLDGNRILSRKSVELMTANHLQHIPHTRFGLGFSLQPNIGVSGIMGSTGEYGWGGAYHSLYWVDPTEDMVVVYLTQLLPTVPIDDHQKVRALVYQAIND